MRSLKTFALAGAVFAGATVVASAADLGPPPAHGGLPPAPYATPVAEVSGWYLRGDIGVAHQSFKAELEDKRFPLTPVARQHNHDFSKVGFAGVGVGYQATSWMRADLTAEYRLQSKFSFRDKNCSPTGLPGVVGAYCAVTPTFNGENGTNFYNGRISSTVLLANGYVDLGNWGGFTPYVGAGVGVANNKVSNLTDIGLYTAYASGAATGTRGVGEVTFTDKSSTNLAWALMAGVSYDLSPGAKLDLGYRYLNMGKVKQYVFNCVGGAPGTCGDYMNYKQLQAHEFKLGLRWMLGGAGYTPTPVAAAPMAYPEPRMIKKF